MDLLRLKSQRTPEDNGSTGQGKNEAAPCLHDYNWETFNLTVHELMAIPIANVYVYVYVDIWGSNINNVHIV